jgi:SAM-dependent methyltransferase
MSDSKILPPDSDHKCRLMIKLRDSLENDSFVKMVLGKYRGPEPELLRIQVRQLSLKGEKQLSLLYIYKTREVTNNAPFADGIEMLENLIGDPFRSVHLFSVTGDVQLEVSKKGKCFWQESRPTHHTAPSDAHDADKKRYLDQTNPFLQALGVTDAGHRVIPSMARKWKQINKFLEIFQHAFASSGIARANAVQVVDFGSGKGYLTFALYDLLQHTHGVQTEVTGIELREDLVGFCNATAKKLGKDGLGFYQGDVGGYNPDSLDILIALHACDTATDQAIYLGIRAGAEIIMCAPCCHKEIRKQMHLPEVLEPVLKFGVHLGQEAEMVTDSLRALLLEANGYKTQLLEFVSLEHTSKNKMLLAIKRDSPSDPENTLKKIEKLKGFYGIKEQSLERLLKG